MVGKWEDNLAKGVLVAARLIRIEVKEVGE